MKRQVLMHKKMRFREIREGTFQLGCERRGKEKAQKETRHDQGSGKEGETKLAKSEKNKTLDLRGRRERKILADGVVNLNQKSKGGEGGWPSRELTQFRA